MRYIPRKSRQKYLHYAFTGATSLAFMPGALVAQVIESPAEEKEQKLEEVVVTGTLIRGVEAVGSQTIGLDKKDITETGAVTTNEILATVPQISNFFNQLPEQDPRGADRNSINRPNLRNLPGINSATGGATLSLVDGHRITPVGVAQSDMDPDIIPANVIDNIAIVTDGGSSLYGADAVGGVINFITLKEFDGVQIDLGYDTGDDFSAWQGSVLAGTSWDSGSGYISVGTTDRDNIKREERDWARTGNWSDDSGGLTLTPSGTECIQPVGAVTTWFWYGAGWTSNPAAPGAGVTPVGDPCDIEAQSSLLPKQERDNVYGAIIQEITEGITLETKAYYMKRKTTYSGYPRGGTVAEPTPTELGVVGVNTGDLYDTAQVGFSYGPNAAYNDAELKLELETWGITPEVTLDLTDTWQLRNTLHYGYSTNHSIDPAVNLTKQAAYVESGALDPLNVAAADGAVVEDILNWASQADTKQELFMVRSIADGEVYELPAGMLRAAIGVEYSQQDAKNRKGSATFNGLSGYRSESRDVQSVFGELSIPVFESLDLSVSTRYDDYDDFGSTTNPNYGFSWTPFEWIKIYGKMGESYNAPTALDALGTADGRYVPGRVTSVPDPNGEINDQTGDDVFLLEGSDSSLAPQTADIWAAGFDLMPLEGLVVNFNYYSIDFKELLGSPDPQDPQAVLLNPDKFIFNPTEAQYNAAVGAVENSAQFASTSYENVGAIVDRRISNTDEAKLEGIDLGVQYYHDTEYGSFAYGVLGNYQSKFDLEQNGAVIDQLKYAPDLYASANIAWSMRNMRARVTVNYTDEYDANPAAAIDQDKVDSFVVTNLYLGYDFDTGSEWTEGLSLRVNVDNLFDEDPPEYRRQQLLNYSGFTLGRIFKLGITKRF
ncbi:MAG: TonB-dependent receptor [Halioglobus sp.]|nr:TonB-dependent receptor [Halioglobus sp.]